jgi:PilZ domain
MSSSSRNWKRIRDRLALQLPVRVHCRETADFEWTEMTRLGNVTPFGAGFTLKRPIEKGRLVHMTIPMPRQLRVFDHVEDQYRVWAIVRYLRSNATDKGIVFYVGVAFIGKRPPESYQQEPWKRYEVATNALDALAVVEELRPDGSADHRTHTRHHIPVDMRVELLDENGAVVQTEHTVTEDISSQGATLFTTLDIARGRFIRLTSEQHGIVAHAAIRSRSTGPDGVGRLHVEFIDKEWPL